MFIFKKFLKKILKLENLSNKYIFHNNNKSELLMILKNNL